MIFYLSLLCCLAISTYLDIDLIKHLALAASHQLFALNLLFTLLNFQSVASAFKRNWKPFEWKCCGRLATTYLKVMDGDSVRRGNLVLSILSSCP